MHPPEETKNLKISCKIAVCATTSYTGVTTETINFPTCYCIVWTNVGLSRYVGSMDKSSSVHVIAVYVRDHVTEGSKTKLLKRFISLNI